MTLSISDKARNKISLRRILIWLGISAFCLVFYLIYNMFSHGVKSVFMTYLFAWPLIMGFLPSMVIYVINRIRHVPAYIDAVTDNAYCCGVATLTVSSMLKGIFDIAGTASIYQTSLLYAGIILIIIAAVSLIVHIIMNRHNN